MLQWNRPRHELIGLRQRVSAYKQTRNWCGACYIIYRRRRVAAKGRGYVSVGSCVSVCSCSNRKAAWASTNVGINIIRPYRRPVHVMNLRSKGQGHMVINCKPCIADGKQARNGSGVDKATHFSSLLPSIVASKLVTLRYPTDDQRKRFYSPIRSAADREGCESESASEWHTYLSINLGLPRCCCCGGGAWMWRS